MTKKVFWLLRILIFSALLVGCSTPVAPQPTTQAVPSAAAAQPSAQPAPTQAALTSTAPAAAQPTVPPAPTQVAPTSAAPASLTVMVHDSFAVTDSLVKQFEQENNVKVTFLKSGDAGSMLNRVILTKDNPQADVLYGYDLFWRSLLHLLRIVGS